MIASEPSVPVGSAGGLPNPGTEALPEEVTERPHPATPLIRGWVVLLAVVIAVGREYVSFSEEPRPLPPLEYILGGAAGLALLTGLAAFFSWRFTRFVIDAEQLRIDTGVLFRRSQRVSFDKVQSIDVVQPLAARIFGLAELQIDVGSSERPRLRYLARTRAYALRDYLLARARGVHAEAADHADSSHLLRDLTEDDEVLLTVPPKVLLIAAATSHEFWLTIAAAVLAAVAGFVFDLPWLALAIAIPTLTTLAGFLGRRVIGQFNFTLSHRPHGLRVSRGLTNLTSQSLPPRRVQALQISQSPVWQRLGLYRIDVEVIGWGQLTDNESSSGVSTILLPAGTIEQVWTAVDAVWPRAGFESVELRGAPARARWLHPFSQPFLRWGHGDQLVVSQHGWLVRRWQVVPHARVQSVLVAQGPVSRRLGLADLKLHTAGSQISVHASGLDADHVLAHQEELLRLVHHPAEVDLSEPEHAPPETSDQGTDSALPTETEADQAG